MNKSPIVIAGCWNNDNQNKPITAETIYQFIYHMKNKHLKLWEHLPKAKKKRGMRRYYRKSVSTIPHRISIHDRPVAIEKRQEFGHFEADLLFTKGSMSANVLVMVERKTRFVSLQKHTSKHSGPIIASVEKVLSKRGGVSVTFDNGSEFAEHWKLNVATYFCDKSSPWQKGSVENMNALLRRYLPFSMDPELISQKYLDQVAEHINSIERKILNFKTPLQAFNDSIQKNLKQPSVSLSQAHDYQEISCFALHF